MRLICLLFCTFSTTRGNYTLPNFLREFISSGGTKPVCGYIETKDNSLCVRSAQSDKSPSQCVSNAVLTQDVIREIKTEIKLECQGNTNAVIVPMCGCVLVILVLLLISLMVISYKLRALGLVGIPNNTVAHYYSTLNHDGDRPAPSEYTNITVGARPVPGNRPDLMQQASSSETHSYLEIVSGDQSGFGSRVVCGSGIADSFPRDISDLSRLKNSPRVGTDTEVKDPRGNQKTGNNVTTSDYLRPIPEHSKDETRLPRKQTVLEEVRGQVA